MMTQVLKKPGYVFTSQEILSLGVTEIRMLIDNLLPKKGLAALTGTSDVGKSYFLIFLAILICSDEMDAFGLKTNREHGSAIIVCTEETAEDICVRISKLLQDRKIHLDRLRFIFDTDNLVSKLRDEIKRQPADLVVIDTLGDLFTGNLNDSIAVRQFLKPYKAIAADYVCLFLFNHHIGKGKENNTTPSKNDVLGSQGIESACRTVLMLRKKSDGKRELTVVKGNYIPEEFKNKGILLSFDPITGFKDTGEIVNYHGQVNGSSDNSVLEKQVLALYPELKSYIKVSQALRKKGFKIDKNKVGEIWKKYHPSILTPTENDGRMELN